MQTRKWGIKVAILFLSLGAASACPGRIIYVDVDAAGANDGSSWADAYNYLQDALADANASPKPVEIRVAHGIYRPDEDMLHPDGTGDREATFQLIDGVTLKGGYAGLGEPDPNAQDIQLYKTILSGDLNGDDGAKFANYEENSYHVVTVTLADETAVLDGFTITAGNADDSSYPNSYGGAIFCEGGGMFNYDGSPVLLNCTLTNNYASWGGGMAGRGILADCMFVANSANYGGGMYGGGSLTNCTFVGNSAAEDGGAIINFDSGPTLIECTFTHNSAGYAGGAVYVCDTDTAGEAMLVGCTLEKNSAGKSGGAVFVYQGWLELTDCILCGNSAGQGGAVATDGSFSTLIDCTLTGNWASQSGGGVWNWSHRLIMMNCSITDNSAEQGGGISNSFGEPILTNCRLTGNSASQSGGGLWNRCGDLCLTNCTFAGNSAERGHALTFNPWEEWCSTDIQLTNCILWDGGNEIWNNDYSAEITIAHSDVQGGPAAVYDPCNVVIWGEGNIDTDPCFADPGYWDANGTPDDANDDFWADGDYHLKSQAGRYDPKEGRWVIDDVTSLCIDAGDPMSPIGLEPFPNGGIINMGAYGGTAEASKSYFGEPPCETIVAGDINGDCAVDFKDFVLMALHWLGGR